jgi:hypothetical protein
MNPWKFSEPVQWHGKGFTLNWDFPRAWWVLVYYHNGESKPWYHRTERSYRFRRWFSKSGQDRFQNIANFNRPWIVLYVFRGFSFWPDRYQLPMDVRILRVHEPEAILIEPTMVAEKLQIQQRYTIPTLCIPEEKVQLAKAEISLSPMQRKNLTPPNLVPDQATFKDNYLIQLNN